ncbi:MAG TPA: DUF4093 domain-containing protein [Clostridiales bacterium]|jgi:ribonuclease M5|nr:DUF4093 domain-containing protein [Clostridiales bacterium]
MIKVKEVIVVEGRYDKNTLSQIVDTTIIETSGFGIFSDKEKLELLRKLASKRGIIILTDSDGAGFVIRNYLKSAITPDSIKNAYIPEVSGKERRKHSPSREGKLGVEGMSPETLIQALRRAGATFEDESEHIRKGRITKSDLYELGLSGKEGAAERRRELTARLGLPEKLSADSLLDILNALYDREELLSLL